MSSIRYSLAIGICMLCMSCGSSEATRPSNAASPPNPSGSASAAPALVPCSRLLGNWAQVEPTGGTTVNEPEDGKVRPTEPEKLVSIEPGRMTITTPAERLDSRFVVEPLSDGTCLLHTRDTLGRPLDITVSFPSERLVRMHNATEVTTAGTLYERR